MLDIKEYENELSKRILTANKWIEKIIELTIGNVGFKSKNKDLWSEFAISTHDKNPNIFIDIYRELNLEDETESSLKLTFSICTNSKAVVVMPLFISDSGRSYQPDEELEKEVNQLANAVYKFLENKLNSEDEELKVNLMFDSLVSKWS